MKSALPLKGRIAVVTGGNTGIGRAIALALARGGADVAAGARRLHEKDAAENLERDLGGNCYAGFLDVRGQASITAFLAEVHKTIGPPSILVNCAGIATHHAIEGHTDADWQAALDVNLTGPFRMTRACLPGMMATGWGRVINIASTAASTGRPDYAAYCASKAGLLGLTRVTALEGAAHGVTAVTISPTWVETDMLHSSAAEKALKTDRNLIDVVSEMAGSNPQQRLVQAEEIADLTAYLCTDSAAALTMEDIQINAGAHW
ncbi:MAG: SDR family oxidoreductase [Pseudomonadota bacterium]